MEKGIHRPPLDSLDVPLDKCFRPYIEMQATLFDVQGAQPHSTIHRPGDEVEIISAQQAKIHSIDRIHCEHIHEYVHIIVVEPDVMDLH